VDDNDLKIKLGFLGNNGFETSLSFEQVEDTDLFITLGFLGSSGGGLEISLIVHLLDTVFDANALGPEGVILFDFTFAFLVKLSSGKGGGIGIDAPEADDDLVGGRGGGSVFFLFPLKAVKDGVVEFLIGGGGGGRLRELVAFILFVVNSIPLLKHYSCGVLNIFSSEIYA